MLNGNTIGSYGIGTSQGQMVLVDNNAHQETPYVFSQQTSGTVTSGFNLGSLNTLKIIVNNTGGNAAGALHTLWTTQGDGYSSKLGRNSDTEPATSRNTSDRHNIVWRRRRSVYSELPNLHGEKHKCDNLELVGSEYRPMAHRNPVQRNPRPGSFHNGFCDS